MAASFNEYPPAAFAPAWPLRGGLALLLLALSGLLGGCGGLYYKTLEKFGVQKREVLVDRVQEARDAQTEAKEQFVSALDQFRSVVQVEGGELEDKYDKLRRELERSEDRAAEVHERVQSVEHVANALFKEWEQELENYSDASLRRASQGQLDDTRRRYEQLLSAMERAETKMEPVLVAFRDQVLFLKHNLNAQAIASLEGELNVLEGNIDVLIRDMEASIEEANAFIREMGAVGEE